MDYKDLADLIFPDVKPIEYYEEKYPKRNLKEGAIVSRFAPSPTGFVHIGGLYQALVARKVSSQTEGVFFLRIEDTDQKREIENGITDIVSSLKDFGIEEDEGMVNETEGKGNYGPYKQSLRGEIYRSYAKHMIELGKAYPCFCSQEEVDEIRKKQEAAKVRPGYYGVWAKCRNLTVEEMAEKIKAGEKYIIRFKSPGREDRKIKHKDVIKGNVDFPENDLDIVIIVSAGNVADPNIVEFSSRDELLEKCRDQLFYPEHRLIDPATSALSVTVGAITRFDEPEAIPNRSGRISVGKKDYMSVFTRIGKGRRLPCRN